MVPSPTYIPEELRPFLVGISCSNLGKTLVFQNLNLVVKCAFSLPCLLNRDVETFRQRIGMDVLLSV